MVKWQHDSIFNDNQWRQLTIKQWSSNGRKKHQLRKKKSRIQKKIVKEIIIWFIIDENMNKIMKKTLIFAKIKNGGNKKRWIWFFVKMIFEGSTGVSLKLSGRRSTAVDEIYPLAVLK